MMVSKSSVSVYAVHIIRSSPKEIARSKFCRAESMPFDTREIMHGNKPGASGVPMSAFPIHGISFKKIHLGKAHIIAYVGTEMIKNALRATVFKEICTTVLEGCCEVKLVIKQKTSVRNISIDTHLSIFAKMAVFSGRRGV